jgi:hypothetical protein
MGLRDGTRRAFVARRKARKAEKLREEAACFSSLPPDCVVRFRRVRCSQDINPARSAARFLFGKLYKVPVPSFNYDRFSNVALVPRKHCRTHSEGPTWVPPAAFQESNSGRATACFTTFPETEMVVQGAGPCLI